MEEVPHLLILGVEVESVFLVTRHLNRFSSNDLDSVSFEATDFHGVVCHDDDFVGAEVGKNLGSSAVVAKVGGETEG